MISKPSPLEQLFSGISIFGAGVGRAWAPPPQEEQPGYFGCWAPGFPRGHRATAEFDLGAEEVCHGHQAFLLGVTHGLRERLQRRHF